MKGGAMRLTCLGILLLILALPGLTGAQAPPSPGATPGAAATSAPPALGTPAAPGIATPISPVTPGAPSPSASPASTPTPSPERTPIVKLNRVDTLIYPTNFASLTILDGSGNLVQGLKEKDFKVLEDGRFQQIIKVFEPRKKSGDIYIVLVIDCSGSMAGKPLDDAKAAAKSFLKFLGANDHVALVKFSESWTTLMEFSTDRAALERAIDTLQPGTSTAFYQAVMGGLNLFDEKNKENKAVVALTDGKNNRPGTVEECIERSHGVSVPVFCVGLGDDLDQTSLRKLALDTGGLYYHAPQSSDLESIYRSIATSLKNQYWIEYKASPENWPHINVEARVRVNAPSVTGESGLVYVVPVQMWKWITYFVLGEVSLFIICFFLYRVLWRRFSMDPEKATKLTVIFILGTTFVWFTFLFIRVLPCMTYLIFVLLLAIALAVALKIVAKK
jgi:VWFA-related protein